MGLNVIWEDYTVCDKPERREALASKIKYLQKLVLNILNKTWVNSSLVCFFIREAIKNYNILGIAMGGGLDFFERLMLVSAQPGSAEIGLS